MFVALSRQRSIQILVGVGLLYLLLVTLEIPFVFRAGFSAVTQESSLSRPLRLNSEEDLDEKEAPTRPFESVSQHSYEPTQSRHPESMIVSRLRFDRELFESGSKGGASELYKSAKVAWEVGNSFWQELQSGKVRIRSGKAKNRSESCLHSVSLSGLEFVNRGRVMVLPCGLTLGSHITLVGKPRKAHSEYDAKDDDLVMVSQFKLELQGLKTVDGEEPPKVLHLNPRLKGDWSGKPVMEQNTCYRMQWGSAQRCEGWKSKAEEETGKSWKFELLLLCMLSQNFDSGMLCSLEDGEEVCFIFHLYKKVLSWRGMFCSDACNLWK